MIIGKLQLVDNIKREIPDNSTGQVSPRDVRQNMINIIDSVHMLTAEHDLNFLNVSTPNTRTTRAGQETLSKLHLQGYSSEDNSAFGYSALSDNYDGTKNTAIGSYSMGCNLYGDSNTAIGFNSLAGNVFGSGNVAVGNFALQRSKFGSFNVAIGHGAGYYVGSNDKYKLYIGSHNLEDACDNPLGSGLVPLMYGDMQNLRLGVATSGLHNYGALQVNGDISPSQDYQHNLGHSSYRWNDLYLCNSINESVYFSGDYVGFGANPPSGQGLVTVAGHLVPSLHNTYALGHPDLRWDGYFNDITVSGTANIENAIYTNIEDCTYHCRTLYLASSGLCDDMGGWAPPCGYLHDEQIEGGGFVLQSSGVDFRRNYEFIFTAPDPTLSCLEEDTPYARSAWNSNISIHVASGSHVKTDRTIGRDNLSLLSENCCYGIFMKKDTDGIREDRTGINEIQLIEIDATGGTFTLTFEGQTTAEPIAYNADADRVKAGLEALSNIGEGNVDVFKGSNSWEIRFTGTLGGQNVSQITCNGAELTKTEKAEVCTTTYHPGVDETQKIIIRADAGEWRLGHHTSEVSPECSSDTSYNEQLGGYFTDPLSYNIEASDLETTMQNCFTRMLGNVSVSLAIIGNTRTYTITFVNDLEETNEHPWLVDNLSLTLEAEECNDDEQNEKINIKLSHVTDGYFNILTYLSESDYDNDCPYYKSANIPFDATPEELDVLLTATCESEGESNVWAVMNGGTFDGDAVDNHTGRSTSISSDGNTVAVGIPNRNGKDGLVQVYRWNDVVWAQLGNDIYPGAESDSLEAGWADSEFGYSVALNGDGSRLIVGAPSYGGNKGRAVVFEYEADSWSSLGSDEHDEDNVFGSDAVTDDQTGFAVSMNYEGDIVAIGSIGNDDGGSNAGKVSIFRLSSGGWSGSYGEITGDAEENCGYSVSLNRAGNKVAIGCPSANSNTGEVKVYIWIPYVIPPTWTQLGDTITGDISEGRFGQSVSLSDDGTTVAVGAPESDIDGEDMVGIARVYDYSSSWTPRGVTFQGIDAEDRLGWSVSLSSDGNTLAIGSSHAQSPANAISNNGSVRVYIWGVEWELVGGTNYGEGITSFAGQFGWAVSLAGDGERLAIGEPLATITDVGYGAGRVSVYVPSMEGGGVIGEGCGWYNSSYSALEGECGIPTWIAGSSHYVMWIDSDDEYADPIWEKADLSTGRNTAGHRIQVGGMGGDWEIEFGNTAHSSSFFNGKDIAPMRLDTSNLVGGATSAKPEFTVVRTHEPIDKAYNKITVSISEFPTSASFRNVLLRAGRYAIRFKDSMGTQYDTEMFENDATIAEVIQGLNHAIGGVNANFFLPYISPHILYNDPVYGDHEGKNRFWDSAGSHTENVPLWGTDKLCAYNSRLETSSTFLGTLKGISGANIRSVFQCGGWAWDGLLSNMQESHVKGAGITGTFDILTHTGWTHNMETTVADGLISQSIYITEMSFAPVTAGYIDMNNSIKMIPQTPNATTRPRQCLAGWIEGHPIPGYDAEWRADGASTHNSHTKSLSYASLGDGIVGMQDGWPTDIYLRDASDSAGVPSQASGPSYNCNRTGKVLNTSWSWFESSLTDNS